MNPWFWELRSDGEFLPPEIANFGEGWQDWKGPLKDAPSVGAEIFVRELVQNFVDAGRDHKRRNPNLAKVPRLVFEFHDLTGAQAKRLGDKLGLRYHFDRFNSLSEDEKRSLRIGNSKTLQGSIDQFKILVVKESYTTGMSGQWEMTDRVRDDQGNTIVRKMRSALLSTVGQRAINGLGAYGEGKRAVIGASVPRIMIAYTCFQLQNITGNVTRRFLGATYWRPHAEASPSGAPNEAKSATGLALWGNSVAANDRIHSGRPIPFDDDQADLLIDDLDIPGVAVRNPAAESDFGTTMIFIEPAFGANEVKWALERNWWPLISDGGAEFEVTDFDGTALPIEPETRPELKTFIENYRVIRDPSTGHVRGANGAVTDPVTGVVFEKEKVEREDLVKEIKCTATGSDAVGTLGLSIDCTMGGWSYKDRDSNWTIVALVRDGMIIEYEPFPRQRQGSTPFVRGVFVTSSDLNPKPSELLRIAEPPLHNHWVEKSDAFPADAVALAVQVYTSIADAVKAFRRPYLSKPEPSSGEFEEFGEAFGPDEDEIPGLPRPEPTPPRPEPTGPTPPRPEPTLPPKTKDPWENIAGESSQEEDPDDIDMIRAEAARKIRLKSGWKDDTMDVIVTLGWSVQEDDDFSVEPILWDDLSVQLPKGFNQTPNSDGVFRCEGTLKKDDYAEFVFTSKYYNYLWSVRPYSVVEPK